MKAVKILPESYKEMYSVDLQKDKKKALLVNAIAVIIAILMAVPMNSFVPISSLFSMEDGFGSYFLRFFVLIVLIVAYMVIHELIHGVAMKICGTQKIKYGYTGMYAFAGSDDYYGKGAYIFIALAPVVLLGIALAAVIPFVPDEWFWVVYFIQITNISGAAGDLFVTVKFAGFPKDILVKDYGVSMVVYSQK
ncbi:MAG: DUF3267 domain-containing protein [Clostridia bacterium]|nr:DUF3267 domain-containing protein [Clostridia bacterium]